MCFRYFVCVSLLQISLKYYTSALPSVDRCDILELSYNISEYTTHFPLHKAFKFVGHQEGHFGQNNQWMYQMNTFKMGEHIGTHMDAPIHFGGSLTVEEVPYTNLVGEACVLHLEKKAAANRDYEVTREDVQNWEATNGNFSSDCFVLVSFGWDQFFDDAAAYLGTATKDLTLLSWPGISGEAAELLAARNVKAIGIDTVSLDMGKTQTFDTHRVFLQQLNVPLFENFRNLAKLPPRGATIVALPMKIASGTGAPVRAFAVGWKENDECARLNGANTQTMAISTVVYGTLLVLLLFLQLFI